MGLRDAQGRGAVHVGIDFSLRPPTIVVLELRHPYTDQNLTAIGLMPGATVLAIEPQEAPARKD